MRWRGREAMSALSTIALVSPILPAVLLVLTLRAKRALDALAPLQFGALLSGAVLAVSAEHAQGLAAAAATVSIAIVALFATVLRKDSLARRAAYSFDWEKFERDFHFYTIITGHRWS
jgi:hypothetical protein